MSCENTSEIFGLPIRNVALSEASAFLVKAASARTRRQAFFVNAHCVNVAASDKAYLATLAAADMLFADGIGMRIAARLAGVPLIDNVNGTDLFPLLCRDAAAAGLSIALLGARPEVARRCGQSMVRRFPDLEVAFTHHGYFRDSDVTAVIREINASGADLLFVAMGVPAQELWISKHADELRIPVLLGVGALFDFYSGAVRRAPRLIRRFGMEWAYRFLLEPRRMFARYILGNPLFIARTLSRRARGRAILRHAPLQG
jgi:N-acetylglucosaminyldiphosphoundecaprenol N-acetyl-beta-D-mannosaminyltransferase